MDSTLGYGKNRNVNRDQWAGPLTPKNFFPNHAVKWKREFLIERRIALPGHYVYDPFLDGIIAVIETDTSNNIGSVTFAVTVDEPSSPSDPPSSTDNGGGGGGSSDGGSAGIDLDGTIPSIETILNPYACAPAPEMCNGVDDDCDGIIDNTCGIELSDGADALSSGVLFFFLNLFSVILAVISVFFG